MRNAPLTKPTDLHAPGALEQLFAYNRQQFGGWFMDATDDAAAAKSAADEKAAADAAAAKGGKNATDSQGNDLGFPKDTPIAEMDATQQAAYWRNESKKHQGRYDNLTGGRSFDEVRKDLDSFQQIQKDQLTPADKALVERYEAGKADALNESSNKAAIAIFRASLEAQGHSTTDVDDLVANFNVANFVKDGDVDTSSLATFAKRFTPAGTATQQTRRDFGGGQRREGQAARGAGGKAEAQRRFGDQAKS